MTTAWYGRKWVQLIAVGFIGVVIGTGGAKTKTVEHTTTVVQTKTVTRNVSPQSCRDAIAAARDAFAIVGDAFGAASTYPTLVSDAAKAGAAQDVSAITDVTTKMDAVQATISADNKKLGAQADVMNAAADRCK